MADGVWPLAEGLRTLPNLEDDLDNDIKESHAFSAEDYRDSLFVLLSRKDHVAKNLRQDHFLSLS